MFQFFTIVVPLEMGIAGGLCNLTEQRMALSQKGSYVMMYTCFWAYKTTRTSLLAKHKTISYH